MERDYSVRSIERALSILKCFDVEHQEIGLFEFVDMLGLNKSTLYRILTNLVSGGFLSMESSGKYIIGNEIVRLANISQGGDLLNRTAMELLQKAARLSGETSVLAKYERGKAICVDRIESSKVLKITSEIGKAVPMLKGATGKSMAAFLAPAELENCIRIQKKEFHDTVKEKELEKEFQKIRQDGYCITDSEVDDGVMAFAFPILGNGTRVLGSVSIAGPNFRFNEEFIGKIKGELLRDAEELSRKLGHI